MTKFEEVYFQFFDDVYLYVLSLCHNESLAEEITQETFFKALKSIDKFKGECKMRVWLCQIAKNTYFSYSKKEKYITNEPYEGKGIECFEQRLVNSETKLEVHKALHSLEEPYKEVFSLRVFGELSFLHIAEIFGKTENWARVTFYRSKLKVKEVLK